MADETLPTLTIAIDADTSALEQQLADCARLGARFGSALSQSLADATIRGKGLSDVMRSLALRLSELALKAAFKPLTDALGGGLAGLVSGLAFAKGGVCADPCRCPSRKAASSRARSRSRFPATASASPASVARRPSCRWRAGPTAASA
jgi:hypothetical protein